MPSAGMAIAVAAGTIAVIAAIMAAAGTVAGMAGSIVAIAVTGTGRAIGITAIIAGAAMAGAGRGAGRNGGTIIAFGSAADTRRGGAAPRAPPRRLRRVLADRHWTCEGRREFRGAIPIL